METGPGKACTFCGRYFTKREHLERHSRGHTKETPFKCTRCGKSFGRSDVLRRHERSNCRHNRHSRADDGTDSFNLEVVDHGAEPVDDLDATSSSLTGIASALDGGAQGMPLGMTPDHDFPLLSLDDFLTDTINGWAQNGDLPGIVFTPPTADLIPDHLPTPSASLTLGDARDDGRNADRSQDYIIDEHYSSEMSRQLRSKQHSLDAAPSAAYLNMCLRLYLIRFHPIFPVIHAASFRPTANNPLLLASMCSIGGLLIGTPEAANHAHQLYSRLNKAILASWETYLSKAMPAPLPMIQAALLGQTFGLLSGRPADRFMTECFQGTMLAWARSIGALDSFQPGTREHGHSSVRQAAPLSNDRPARLRTEEKSRLALALYVHDAETASLASRQPYLRHQTITYRVGLVSDSIFSSSTFQEQPLRSNVATGHLKDARIADWIDGTGGSQDHALACDALAQSIQISNMGAYAALSSLGACVLDRKTFEDLPPSEVQRFNSAFRLWYIAYLSSEDRGRNDELCLGILWHHYCAQLYTNDTLVERSLLHIASGEIADGDREKIASWLASVDATRALAHSCLVLGYAKDLRLSLTPPIHLARVIFGAGKLFAACSRLWRLPDDEELHPQDASHKTSDLILELPNLDVIEQADGRPRASIAAWVSDLLVHSRPNLLIDCIGVLRRLTCWGVAADFADNLQQYI